MTVNDFIPWLILLPLMGAFINGVFGSKLPKTLVYVVACLPVLIGAAMSGLLLWMIAAKDTRIVYDMGTWFSAGDLSIGARFAVDQLSGIMICVITGIVPRDADHIGSGLSERFVRISKSTGLDGAA